MNPILSMIGGGNSYKSMMLKAVGAMIRGESAQDFMMNLAKTTPELKGLDLSDLENTAHQLSSKKGIDEGKLAEQIKSDLTSMS